MTGRLVRHAIVALALCATQPVLANGSIASERAIEASQSFANNCFNPLMTAARADQVLAADGVRVDFYDLDPFSNAAPSPAVGRAVTNGSDRRCEVAFDGDFSVLAASAAVAGLTREGITTTAPLPNRYTPLSGTALLAARQLNPRRIAVVHVGTRPGPNGVETFLMVERLTPLEPVQ